MNLIQHMGMGSVRTGSITIATAGTELPLMGVAYSTGNITVVVGNNVINGGSVAPTWNTTNLPRFDAGNMKAGSHYLLLTAEGKAYRLKKILGTTQLEIEGTISTAETNATYQIYELPETSLVVFSNNQAATDIMYVGPRGSIAATTGLAIGPGQTIGPLPIDLSQMDLWVDSSGNSKLLSYMLIR